MDKEKENINPDEQESQEPEEIILDRKLSIAMNVDKINQMRDAANHLGDFINIIEDKIGLVNLNMTVSINPYEDKGDKSNPIGYKTTDAYGEKVEVVEELEYDDEIEEDKLRKRPARRVGIIR